LVDSERKDSEEVLCRVLSKKRASRARIPDSGFWKKKAASCKPQAARQGSVAAGKEVASG